MKENLHNIAVSILIFDKFQNASKLINHTHQQTINIIIKEMITKLYNKLLIPKQDQYSSPHT